MDEMSYVQNHDLVIKSAHGKVGFFCRVCIRMALMLHAFNLTMTIFHKIKCEVFKSILLSYTVIFK